MFTLISWKVIPQGQITWYDGGSDWISCWWAQVTPCSLHLIVQILLLCTQFLYSLCKDLSTKVMSHVPVAVLRGAPLSMGDPTEHTFSLSHDGVMISNTLKFKLSKDCKAKELRSNKRHGGFLVTRGFINKKCYFLHMINSVLTRGHLGKSVLPSRLGQVNIMVLVLFYSHNSVINIQGHRQV